MNALLGLFLLAQQAAPETQLFDGKTLDGWVIEGTKDYKDKDGATVPVWSVRDGLLVCQGKGFGFLRYGKKEFADFAFHVEYRMKAKCNSGIGIRTVPFDAKKNPATRPSYACYEIQLMDDAGKPPNKHSSGALYRYVAPSANPVKAAGEWNSIDVECIGPRIKISINGQSIVDVDQSTIAEIKNKPLRGYVCLQNHGGHIEFRNPRIRALMK